MTGNTRLTESHNKKIKLGTGNEVAHTGRVEEKDRRIFRRRSATQIGGGTPKVPVQEELIGDTNKNGQGKLEGQQYRAGGLARGRMYRKNIRKKSLQKIRSESGWSSKENSYQEKATDWSKKKRSRGKIRDTGVAQSLGGGVEAQKGRAQPSPRKPTA